MVDCKIPSAKNYHPGSFEYKWLNAPDAVRDRYIVLSAKVSPKNEAEKQFLLWMAGQEKSVRDGFIKIITRFGVV